MNLAYLRLPDCLMTLKWKLHRAIINARTLDQDKQAELESQRLWMKQHVRSLPVYRTYTHAMALSALEERFADPLACTLGYPMAEGQFDAFKRELQKYTGKSELGYAVSHIVQRSLRAQYQDSADFKLPFKDRVGSYGAGRLVHLGFMSNRPFDSSLRGLQEIKTSHTVIDATTGILLTAPKNARELGDFQRWLSKKGRGDFGYDGANGGGLISVRGAKLVELDVEMWHEADAISDKQLRALLNGPSASDTVSLKKHSQDPFQDAPYCYVGVLTKEGRLAVVAVEGFSGRSSINVRTRVRSVLLEDAAEEVSAVSKALEFLMENAMAKKTHTRRIDGDHVKAGMISGKVKGGFGPYSVFLEHDNWKDKLGGLPHLLVKSGETFEFSNVPVGECIVTATPMLVINKGKHQKATLTTAIEVKDKQTATANLIDPQQSRSKVKSVTLPEVHRRDIKTVLDLGSGELIENFGRNGDLSLIHI